jgi:hypothetical protein
MDGLWNVYKAAVFTVIQCQIVSRIRSERSPLHEVGAFAMRRGRFKPGAAILLAVRIFRALNFGTKSFNSPSP